MKSQGSRLDGFGPRLAGMCGLFLLAGATFVLGACGSDTPGQKSCSSHADCEIGTVCGADDKCIETGCENCQDSSELICLTTDENPQGVCSRPECETSSDPNATCQGGQCKIGQSCQNDSDCPDGMKCSIFSGQCVSSTSDAGVDATIPDAGPSDTDEKDDTMMTPDDSGTESDTPAMKDAPGGDVCPAQTCPAGGNPEADKWSYDFCACVECTSKSDCGSGEECRGGICQGACTQSCKQSGSSSCPMGKPYCISDCCVECVGRMDCDSGEVCVDGTCSSAPENCTQNPGSCPTGHTCDTQSGKCVKQTSGNMCDPQKPGDCPSGEFCDPNTKKCKAPTGGSGGQSCGLCGSNCQCPGSLTCSQQLFACTGCEVNVPVISPAPPDKKCPSGQTCIPASSFGGGLPNFCTSSSSN